MSFQKFKGVCVGGIADGREYQHDKPEMSVEQRKKIDGVEVKTGQRTDYKFLLLLGNLRGDIGVWVPAGVEVDEVITRILKYYKPNQRELLLPTL